MPAPYYGNPLALRVYNPALKATLEGPDASEIIDQFDSIIRPVLESDLSQIFKSWPEPDNGATSNPISSLWVLLMSHHLQMTRSSGMSAAGGNAVSGNFSKMYDDLLQDIKSKNKIVPGAVRFSSGPKNGQFARNKWKISDRNNPEEPTGVGDMFTGTIRGNK
jgi:hypothetical protein